MAEQAKQALRTKQSQTQSQDPGRESLAEQARKALQPQPTDQPQTTDADSNSLGEQARRIVQERNFLRALRALPRRPPFHLELAVQAPAQPSEQTMAQAAPAARPSRGATPASQQFSLSQIFHSRGAQAPAEEPLPKSSPVAKEPSTLTPRPPLEPVTKSNQPPTPEAQPAPEAKPVPQPPVYVPAERPAQPAQVDAVLLPPKPAAQPAPEAKPVPKPPAQAPAAQPAQPVQVDAVLLPPPPAAPPAPEVKPVPKPPAPVPAAQPPQPAQIESVLLPPPALNIQTDFKVKYVGQDAVYLIGGRAAGLTQGTKLTIKRRADSGAANDMVVVAELEVASVAATSAVCDVKSATGEIRAGDIAYLSELDAEVLAQARAIGGQRKYPQVVTFTEGDPLDEEAREEIPRPPLPEVNRARGRVGLDYSGISSHGSVASSSSQIGGVLRADITRIGGTYWNMSGYWRGRLTSNSYAGQQTLQDLINRTYHLSVSYDNPKSNWVAGFGRLYLPWASSLDTIDGGYVGRKLGHGATAGMFAGSTPDPTSWDYNPDRRIAGVFVNFEGGSFDSVHYTSTSGVALSSLGWVLNRPFIFFENGIFFKRYFSIYQSAQADDPRPAPGVTRAGAGLSRSYTTLRFQPHKRISFDLNHNYFRDVPTFSVQLIGTGLVDKYLFQGLSAGVRVEPVRHISVYTDIGRSDRTGDQKTSINQLYGVSWDRIWKTGLRADLRASKFDSSFGSGSYRSLSLSRNFGDSLHWQIQAGRQTLVSTYSAQGASRFINSSVDASFARHYFLQGDFTMQRGSVLDYDQWIFTFGYRFDNRSRIGASQ
ncbi:MAG: hypothetical protein ABSG52_16475 [Terriglobales bacterium]